MRKTVLINWFGLCFLLAGLVAADESLAPKLHPWGAFPPGAWKMVRVVTETLDHQGVVISTTTHDTRTTLERVDKTSVTLAVDVTVEVAGKRFKTEPQKLEQAFHSEGNGGTIRSKPAVDAEVVIDGQKYPCRMIELEYDGPSPPNVTTSKVYYSESIAPHLLKRESTTIHRADNSLLARSTFEVIALNLPWRGSGEIKAASLVKSTLEHPKGSSETFAFTSPEVPGGVMSHSSKEMDTDGRIQRRSALELIDYSVECEDEPPSPPLFKRRLRQPRE